MEGTPNTTPITPPLAAPKRTFFSGLSPNDPPIPSAAEATPAPVEAVPLASNASTRQPDAAESSVPLHSQETPAAAQPPVATDSQKPEPQLGEAGVPDAAPVRPAMGLTQFRRLQKRRMTSRAEPQEEAPVMANPTSRMEVLSATALPHVPQAEVQALAVTSIAVEVESAPTEAAGLRRVEPTTTDTPPRRSFDSAAAPTHQLPENVAPLPDYSPRMMSYTTYMRRQQARNRRLKAAAVRHARREAACNKKLIAEQKAKEVAAHAAVVAQAQAEAAHAAVVAQAQAEAAQKAAAAALAEAQAAMEAANAAVARAAHAVASEFTLHVPLRTNKEPTKSLRKRPLMQDHMKDAVTVPTSADSTPLTATAETPVDASRPVVVENAFTGVELPAGHPPSPAAAPARAMVNANRLRKSHIKKRFFAVEEPSPAGPSDAVSATEDREAPAVEAVGLPASPREVGMGTVFENRELPQSTDPKSAAAADPNAAAERPPRTPEAVDSLSLPQVPFPSIATPDDTPADMTLQECAAAATRVTAALEDMRTPPPNSAGRGTMSDAKLKKLRKRMKVAAAPIEAVASHAYTLDGATPAVLATEASSGAAHQAEDDVESPPAQSTAEDTAVASLAAVSHPAVLPEPTATCRVENRATTPVEGQAETLDSLAEARPVDPPPRPRMHYSKTLRQRQSFSKLVVQKAAEVGALPEPTAAPSTAATVATTGNSVEDGAAASLYTAAALEYDQEHADVLPAPPELAEPLIAATNDCEHPVKTNAFDPTTVPAPNDEVRHTYVAAADAEETATTCVASESAPAGVAANRPKGQPAAEDVTERRLSARKRIKRHGRLAAERREQRGTASPAAPQPPSATMDPPLVPSTPTMPSVSTGVESSAALTLPNGHVVVESLTEGQMELTRDHLDRAWDVGLRYDWNMRTLALTLPPFKPHDPRLQHPYLQLFGSKPAWFLKEVNGVDASQMREVMEAMKKTLRAQFIFKRV